MITRRSGGGDRDAWVGRTVGPVVRLVVDGEVHPALARAADLRTLRITSHEPDLEAVFLARYRPESPHGDPVEGGAGAAGVAGDEGDASGVSS